MGAKVGGDEGKSKRGSFSDNAEINVVPFVDIMLVLLIIFMVAAPLLTVGVPIDLPETKAKELNTESKPITITVTPEGDIYLLEAKVTIETLIDQLNAAAPNGAEERIYVRGDQSANYGEVMRVMGVLSAAGYSKIGLITAQDQVR